MAEIELREVSLKYLSLFGETHALSNLSLSVEQGQFVGIVGPSGCGKSTLLSLIAGMIRPTSGQVLIAGRPVTGPTADVGYMLQQDFLFEWRTIESNCHLGLELTGQKNPARLQAVAQMLEDYGLGAFRRSFPCQLSGGMRQRAALIRTLAINPRVLLLDEPFSALDYQTRLTMQVEVSSILRDAGKTVLLVTHDIAEAVAMCDRIIVLSKRPGTVKADVMIELGEKRPGPMEARKSPAFGRYFNRIWEELDVHVQPVGALAEKG
ncbi:MAG: ABC transporter ATP-binding protein [Bacillota bacterium]|jgi:NitT/TauT family transport system ATP-binding protein